MAQKERFYEALKESMQRQLKITAADLADKLNLSRQVFTISYKAHDDADLLVKTSTRPVYWFPVTLEKV